MSASAERRDKPIPEENSISAARGHRVGHLTWPMLCLGSCVRLASVVKTMPRPGRTRPGRCCWRLICDRRASVAPGRGEAGCAPAAGGYRGAAAHRAGTRGRRGRACDLGCGAGRIREDNSGARLVREPRAALAWGHARRRRQRSRSALDVCGDGRRSGPRGPGASCSASASGGRNADRDRGRRSGSRRASVRRRSPLVAADRRPARVCVRCLNPGRVELPGEVESACESGECR